ncbi:hypothetical protein ABGB18_33155 [Nonomuraea sp. B12E4]
MSALLEMEPRVAGTGVVEPVVEFEQRWESQVDRAECPYSNPGVSGGCPS